MRPPIRPLSGAGLGLPFAIPSHQLQPGDKIPVVDDRGRSYVLYRSTTPPYPALLAPGHCHHQPSRELMEGTVEGRRLCCACPSRWAYEGTMLHIPGANHSAIETGFGRGYQAVETDAWIHFGPQQPKVGV